MCVEEKDLKAVEFFLARSFSKARKSISGSGASKTRVRVTDETIFVKMNMEYTGLEKKMLKYLEEKNEKENYYRSIQEETKSYAQKVIDEICDLKVISIDFRIDVDNEFAFSIVILDGDLENLIRNGTVERPNQMPDDPKNL